MPLRYRSTRYRWSRSRLRRISRVGHQAGHDPRHLRVDGGILDNRPVAVDNPAAGLFGPGPQLTEIGLVLPVRTVHELEVADRGDEPVDVTGAKLVPRQLVDHTRAELVGRKRARQRGVRRPPIVVACQVPALDGPAMRFGREDQSARMGDEAGFGGEHQRRPYGVRHTFAAIGNVAEAVEDLRFGETAPRSPQRAHRVADQSGPVTLEVSLVPFEHQPEELVERLRGEIVFDRPDRS